MSELHPGLVLIAAGVIAFFLPERLRGIAGLAGSAAAMAAFLLLDNEASMSYVLTENLTLELIAADRLSQLFGLIFSVMAVICSIYSFRGEGRAERCASLIYAGCSLGVVLAGDWISLICFWEVMAVSSWVLVYVGGTRSAVRASYRYLVMHLLGGNLMLAGIVMILTENGAALCSLAGCQLSGSLLVLIGVCINAGVPPLHTWIPDAYPESTFAGTVYMGSYTTKAAIYVLLRFFAGTEELVMYGAIMAVFGACMALIENDLRRLLSYHIVSQLGMMIAALGTGTAVGVDGAALHAAFNVLYKGVLLMGAGAVIYATGKRKITELSGLGQQMPVLSICFLIASLSIAGVPFLNGFASKTLIMEALHEQPAAYWLVMLAGIGTWLSITLKINYFVFWGKKYCGPSVVLQKKVSAWMQAAIVCGTVLCIVTGAVPQIFYEMTPYGTVGHPFTTEHILEYAGLFVGASLPFAALLSKMAPHAQISLDFDWFFRKGLPPALNGMSGLVNGFFSRLERAGEALFDLIRYMIRNPGIDILVSLQKRSAEREETERAGMFEGDVPVSAFMNIFIVFCVVAFIVIMILE